MKYLISIDFTSSRKYANKIPDFPWCLRTCRGGQVLLNQSLRSGDVRNLVFREHRNTVLSCIPVPGLRSWEAAGRGQLEAVVGAGSRAKRGASTAPSAGPASFVCVLCPVLARVRREQWPRVKEHLTASHTVHIWRIFHNSRWSTVLCLCHPWLQLSLLSTLTSPCSLPVDRCHQIFFNWCCDDIVFRPNCTFIWVSPLS